MEGDTSPVEPVLSTQVIGGGNGLTKNESRIMKWAIAVVILLIILFIAYHVWNTRVQGVFFGRTIDYAYMARYFAPTPEKLFYMLGIVCACYHFSHGLFNIAHAVESVGRRRSSG